MPTVKFILQQAKEHSNVYVRLSVSRECVIKRKTGCLADAKKWNKDSGFPSGRDGKTENFKRELESLKTYILRQFADDNSKGKTIDGKWLEIVIDGFFHRSKPEELYYLVNYGEKYIADLPYKAVSNGRNGVKPSTVGKYRNVMSKIRGFEAHHQVRLLVKDIDLDFRSAFYRYLEEIDGLSKNTIGRTLRALKTIVLDARNNDIPVSNKIHAFKGFTEKVPVVSLTPRDIEKLKAVKLSKQRMDVARDWLLISCFTAQRASDLLRMNSSMIEVHEGRKLIYLAQKKTEKDVYLPIHPEVQAILDKRGGEFPPTFGVKQSSTTMFNRYIKEVCREAGIDDLTKGNLRDEETELYGGGIHPKWKLVSSHIGRRSFATNFYSQEKYPTPLLMNVTAHSTEQTFLTYNGRKSLDLAIQLSDIWERK